MPAVTKLKKIDAPTDAPVEAPVETPATEPELAPESTPVADQNRSCMFVLGYFVFVYLAMVAAFWMLAQVTHQSDRRLGSLHDAQTATQIRDALATEFGTPRWLKLPAVPVIPSTQSVIENGAAALGNTITNQVTNQVNNAAQNAVTTGTQEGAAAVQAITPK